LFLFLTLLHCLPCERWCSSVAGHVLSVIRHSGLGPSSPSVFVSLCYWRRPFFSLRSTMDCNSHFTQIKFFQTGTTMNMIWSLFEINATDTISKTFDTNAKCLFEKLKNNCGTPRYPKVLQYPFY